MSEIIQKRMTASIDGDFAVFLIGMRVNRWWKVHQWLPMMSAMPRMLKELSQDPELGLLGHEMWFGRTTIVLQYWRSPEHLLRYAHAREAAHLPAWREFNRRVGTGGDVGVWHETYLVRPGAHESIYVNMPAFGLGRAGALVEATGHRQGARGRLGQGTAS
jgi:hypothetical protein